MNFEIDIKDYLSNEEIKYIASEEVRNIVRQQLRNTKDIETLLTNTSYRIVWAVVEEWYKDHDIQFEKQIEKKVREIIDGLSAFSIFYRNDGIVHQNASPAQMMLDNAIKENEPIIKQRVAEIVREYPFKDLIDDSMADVFTNILTDIVYIGAKKFKECKYD